MAFDLSFCDQYLYGDLIKSKCNYLLSELVGGLGENISIVTFGSLVKGGFSFDINTSYKTLSDFEFLVIKDNLSKKDFDVVSSVSSFYERKWFLKSEFFHIDIRLTKYEDLIKRSNLLAFRSAFLVFGDCNINELKVISGNQYIPYLEVIEKCFVQMNLISENQNISESRKVELVIYLKSKVYLLILEVEDFSKRKSSTNTYLKIKRDLDFYRWDSKMNQRYKYLLDEFINQLPLNHNFFTKKQLLNFLHHSETLFDNYKIQRELEEFFTFHKMCGGPQVRFYNKLLRFKG